ncbi:hypothetical protein RJ640_001512 [Escallonia rubra]|uniref:Uncharacterized protein n=1 Tax=Escallonia rubra TaxID=112253 RepID=A0AA88RFG9_9ASTE|nr:hypothetical protein RJ640_001512 [Escallonia rubra]
MEVLKCKNMTRGKGGWVNALLKAPPSTNAAPEGKQLLKTDPSPRPLLCTRRSCALAKYPRDTLRKIMLGNTKVNRMSVNDPSKFTKYPMKGKAAVTSVFPEKRNARREIRRLMFPLECMPSSRFRNLVSRAS